MSTRDSIPTPLQTLLKKIEFIGLIQQGQKPNVSNLSFADATSWRGSAYRRWLGEDHERMMKFIDETIEQSIRDLKTYKEGAFHDIIIAALRRAKKGIQNLKKTYHDYPEVVTWAMVVAVNIAIQIGDDVTRASSPENGDDMPPPLTPSSPPVTLVMKPPKKAPPTELL